MVALGIHHIPQNIYPALGLQDLHQRFLEGLLHRGGHRWEMDSTVRSFPESEMPIYLLPTLANLTFPEKGITINSNANIQQAPLS